MRSLEQHVSRGLVQAHAFARGNMQGSVHSGRLSWRTTMAVQAVLIDAEDCGSGDLDKRFG